MFATITDTEALASLYDRAMKQKPGVDGVLASSLGWVVDRGNYQEVLVSFKDLDQVISSFESSAVSVDTVDAVETVSEPTAETTVDSAPAKKGRKKAVVEDDTSTESTDSSN